MPGGFNSRNINNTSQLTGDAQVGELRILQLHLFRGGLSLHCLLPCLCPLLRCRQVDCGV